MSKAAVILPIYNQERLLARALDSLAAQTDRQFVAVCVDDGSTDKTAEVLDSRMRRSDFEMRVVRQPNAGVSAARNAGLTAALSSADVDAVMFLDPDDWYEPSCVETARAAHRAHPRAVVEWRFAMSRGGVSAFSPAERLEPNIWCKLYPRMLVEDVRFCASSDIAEDLVFNLEVECRHRPEIVRIDSALYHYEENDSSAMHRPLTVADFERRRAILEHLVSCLAGDAKFLNAAAQDEIPELLKQFYRQLKRVPETERPAATAVFRSALVSLRRRGLLQPGRRLKDLKYYLRFRFWSGRRA